MNDYEDDAIYNLGETCIDSLTIGELLELSGVDPDKYLTGLKDKRLTYAISSAHRNMWAEWQAYIKI